MRGRRPSTSDIFSDFRFAGGEEAVINPTGTLDELKADVLAARESVIQEMGFEALPGALEAVARLSAKYPCALVTGSTWGEVEQVLRFFKVQHLFERDRVFTCGDVIHGKPNPEGYLKAAHRLQVPIEHCVVFEDSTAGIAAARSSGAVAVGVRAGNHSGQDQSAAHRIIDSFTDVTDSFLASLLPTTTGSASADSPTVSVTTALTSAAVELAREQQQQTQQGEQDESAAIHVSVPSLA